MLRKNFIFIIRRNCDRITIMLGIYFKLLCNLLVGYIYKNNLLDVAAYTDFFIIS